MSNYLRDSGAFEKAVSRGSLSYRSSELKALVKAIAEYTRGKTRAGITDVRDCWNAWREKDPKEFADRGITLANDFELELKADCEWLGVDFESADEDEWDAPAIPKARTLVINRHKLIKKTGKYAASYGGSAYGAAQKGMALASGVGIKGALLGGAGALSATGIGALAVGGVTTLASSGLALKSYSSTGGHLKKLVDLWNHRNTPELKRCGFAGEANPMHEGNADALALLNDSAGHDMVANQVLPYIIKQKSRKLGRKKTSAIPVIGLVEGGRAILNNLAKRWKGTQGKARLEYAKWLANHFCECDCELSRQIVAELYSVEEMYWLLDQEADEAATLLAEKMQST
jgi:hypothetical protein